MVDEPHTAAIRYEAGICPNEVTQLNVFFWREASPLTLCKSFNPVLCNCLQALRVENENETKLGEAGELVKQMRQLFDNENTTVARGRGSKMLYGFKRL